MKIKIPLPCPSCNGRMYATKYDAPLNVLKDRSWLVCTECSYEIEAEDFKRNLLTI